MSEPTNNAASLSRQGLIAGITAYTIWGFFPFYFKATEQISAVELVAHRIIWSVPFGLMIILFRNKLAMLLQL